MRRFILLIVLIHAFIVNASAQNAFLKKDLYINGGVALMQYRKHSFDQSERAGRSIPFFISAEYGVHPYFSVGGFAGYHSRQFRYWGQAGSDTLSNAVFKSRYYTTGIKGTFHFTSLLEDQFNWELDSDHLDLYTSLLVGYQFNRINRANDWPIEEDSKPVIGAVVGARYFLNARVALFGEFGPGIFGLGSLGVTARF